MEQQSEEWRKKVEGLLTGINRYNPEIIETLEQYVSFQAASDAYDFEANLALLKLYQFRPNCINRDMTAQVLLKALTRMPSTDFVTLKCVLAMNLQQDATIRSIIELHGLLECCQFKSFWSLLAEDHVTETANLVTPFRESARKYICSVLDMSYQSIPYALLQEYLGGLEDDPLAALIKECGWSLQAEGGVVFIRNQETTIRPKKILAKIEFENVSGILATAASR